jgi:PAS domain S-box-containing protein
LLPRFLKSSRIRLVLAVVIAMTGLAAVAFLSVNVERDLKLLSSARSDNVQWTLSQTEVDFVDLQRQMDIATAGNASDFDDLRREFDIFYSRISTLEQSSIYKTVREIPQFGENLATVRAFLNEAVVAIDGNDAKLVQSLPELLGRMHFIRSSVRGLSSSGLNFFANDSDNRRESVSITLIQLAIWVVILLLALGFLAIYLAYLNRQNVRRRLEAIQTSKRMKVVTSTALDAVIVCDLSGRVLDFNEAAEQIFGYDSKEVIGKELGALIIPQHLLGMHEAGMKRMRESGEQRVVGKGRIKLEAKRANGQLFPVELAVQSAETDSGTIFISFLRDISHRIASEEALIDARDHALAGEKSKADFLATMSHEIRTPLNGLLGNLTLLGDTNLSEQQQTYIKHMGTSGRLLMSHISDVLDIAKYDAGKLQLRPVAMNLSTLIQDIVDSQSRTASRNNTVLSWKWVGPSNDWIYGDQERIQHVLMNVIGNAVKFTHEGTITVEVLVEGKETSEPDAVISVKDTGIGIRKDLSKMIFDDFVTGDTSYNRVVEGTGLGLGIARRFVIAMGGAIDVESEEGKGSLFTIRLPITPIEKPKPVNEIRGDTRTVRPLQILLVEDNEINRLVAREMMAANGHHITEAHNGEIAVELANAHAFDMIFMDISMPVMDGRTATRTIRASGGLCAQVPIIALTANAVAQEQEAFLTDGMNCVLTKPLSRENLLGVIEEYTDINADALEEVVLAVDTTHLQDLVDSLGAEAFEALLSKFCIEIDQALIDLKNDAPLEDAAMLSHKMSGSAAVFGTNALRDAFNSIEQAARSKDHPLTAQAIETLPDVWDKTKASLQRMI